jgi:hypothetical protein
MTDPGRNLIEWQWLSSTTVMCNADIVEVDIIDWTLYDMRKSE